VPPFWRALSVRLVVKRTIIVMVPIIALLITLPLSAPVFNLTACISTADDVVQVTVVSGMPSGMPLRWSDAAGQVPVGTLPVVIFVTPISILSAVD
jgi:hypothetical protein